jgi:hypothetical protein
MTTEDTAKVQARLAEIRERHAFIVNMRTAAIETGSPSASANARSLEKLRHQRGDVGALLDLLTALLAEREAASANWLGFHARDWNRIKPIFEAADAALARFAEGAG